MSNKQASTAVATTARDSLTMSRESGGAYLIPQSFGQVVEFAKDMSRAGTAVPKHLRDNPGACMAVAMQAFEWGMSPFAVANKSYSVNDRVAYEAQLIAAVVNTRSGLQGRLKYKFEGEGANLRCTVTGILDGEAVEYRSPLFKDITPKNSPLWKSDPEQQLGYYSARAWARRHVPEVILGVYDREEVAAMEAVDVSPPPAPSTQEPPRTIDAMDVESEPIENEPPAAETGQSEKQSFNGFESLGEYMEALEQALSGAHDEASIEEAWTEFDPLALFQDDETMQAAASGMKQKAIARVEQAQSDDEPPSAGGLFTE